MRHSKEVLDRRFETDSLEEYEERGEHAPISAEDAVEIVPTVFCVARNVIAGSVEQETEIQFSTVPQQAPERYGIGPLNSRACIARSSL